MALGLSFGRNLLKIERELFFEKYERITEAETHISIFLFKSLIKYFGLILNWLHLNC